MAAFPVRFSWYALRQKRTSGPGMAAHYGDIGGARS